jgi:hypothetical protein
VYILGEEEALFVDCTEAFEEKQKNGKKVGKVGNGGNS